jgi:glucose uptake protein
MYTPDSFAASLVLMILSMLCWGSWANTFTLCRGKYRFELFYWDYVAGVMLGVLGLSALLAPASAVFHGGMAAGNVAWAVLAGIVFNLGNVLLVAAISLAGLSVAFPICIGLALLIGVGVGWYIAPAVPLGPLVAGSALILAAMVMDAVAYRAIAGKAVSSTRGVLIAVLGGVFMGSFPPCLQKAMVGSSALDPYAAVVLLGVGIVLCAVATNYAFMRWPIAGGPPVTMGQYVTASLKCHALGLLGGTIWAAGSVLNFIAGDKVSVAISYAFGTGATLVAVLWGVLVWHEFRGAPPRSRLWLVGMFASFLAGIAVIAWAKSTMPPS